MNLKKGAYFRNTLKMRSVNAYHEDFKCNIRRLICVQIKTEIPRRINVLVNFYEFFSDDCFQSWIVLLLGYDVE